MPFVPAVTVDPEHDLRNLLLGGSGAIPIEALQHSLKSRALLAGQASVRWNSTSVEGSEQAADGFKPIKPVKAERYKRDECIIFGRDKVGDELNVLAIAELVAKASLVVAAYAKVRR